MPEDHPSHALGSAPLGNRSSPKPEPLLECISAGVKVIDLSREMFAGMPQSPNHPEFRMALQRRHGDMVRADGSSAANELIVTGGHVGTHVDALCHVSYKGRLHNDLDAAQVQAGGKFSALGIETMAPVLCRGVLLDIPAVLGISCCPPGYEITPDDLEAASCVPGAAPSRGCAILVRSGWGQHFSDRERYIGKQSGVPGPSESGARWLAEHSPVVVGADTIAFERLAPGAGHAVLPAHRVLLVKEGIHIIEMMDLEELSKTAVVEFVLILAPLKLQGATGSPVRPLAVVSAPSDQSQGGSI